MMTASIQHHIINIIQESAISSFMLDYGKMHDLPNTSTYHTSWQCMPEDHNLDKQQCENL
jgi:hypothetical protein